MNNFIIRLINSDDEWNLITQEIPPHSYTQSTVFYHFCIIQKEKAFRFAMYDHNNILQSYVLAHISPARAGNLLVVSRGPCFINNRYQSDQYHQWCSHLKNLASSKGCVCVRIAPPWHYDSNFSDNVGGITSPIQVHSEQTIEIDLTLSEKELFASFRESTRRWLRKALKQEANGEIMIEMVHSITPEMYEVYDETAQRGGFTGFSLQTLQNELTAFDTYAKYRCFCAYHITNGAKSLVSWGFLGIDGKIAYYRHGANRLVKGVYIPYLLYWYYIQELQKLNIKSLDLWGVAKKGDSKDSLNSISQFKTGFGGNYIELPSARDYPTSYKYPLRWLVDTYHNLKKGRRFRW